MSDPIDPRLYASSLPPRSQSYTTGPISQNSAQPYYLPSPVQQQQPPPPPPLSQPGVPSIDPALDPSIHASPADHDVSHDDDDHDDDGEDTPAASGSAKSPGDLKRPRACDSCRGLKVRCDQENPTQPCKRCAKAGRPCITTPPTRKRQKKADSRVAELERKIDALTATLHAQKSGVPDFRSPGVVPHGSINPSNVPTNEGAFRLGSLNHDWSSSPTTRYPDIPPGYGPAQSVQRGPEPKRRKLDDGNSHASFSEDMDALHRDLTEHPEMKRASKKGQHSDHSHINTLIDQLLSPDVAERIFFRYVNDICPHFPAVPIPPGTTARELRDKKPLLFLAIVAGSSHGSAQPLVSQDVQRELTKLLKDQLADVIWRNGEKSLEIVQSLQVAVLWYRPPLHFEQHNFYMMVNVAAVMALDLGLGRRATPNVMKLAVGPFRRCHPNSGGVDSRRTFLVCYYLCMSITMVLRRPILLRWTKYMEESVKILETSPDAYPSDKVLVQHVKMAHIGENISVQFSMDDPSVDVAISEPKVIYALKIFENELQQLRDENAKMDGSDPAIRLSEHVINLYLHEIALHNNHGAAADFQPPFSEFGPPSSSKKDAIGPAHIGALGECLTATHGILDTILGIPFEILVTLPVIFCVRSIYAIVCLMKMWVSVTSSSEVGSIIRKEHLQLESYSERLVNMFNAIVSQDAQSPHGKFYFVAKRLQERFVQIQEGASKEQSENNEESRQQPNQPVVKAQSGPSSSSQTPLHLLSEVAMGNSNPPQSQVQSQQSQGGVQAQTPTSQQPIQQGWYLGMSQQPADVVGVPQSGFDPNFDFTQFDLSMGSDADLTALFIPDSMLWNFQPDPMPGYGNF